MLLKCLGSSSKGNCYLLQTDRECLAIECGVRLMEVKKALGFDVRKIVGCIVSHQHNDHIGHLKEFLQAGIDVYASDETQEAVDVVYGELLQGVPERKPFYLGGFLVTPFYVPHDGTPCYGYKVFHPEMGNLLFLTDLEYCKYKFQNISQILVEANYSKEIIEETNPNYVHVAKGHMELETMLDLLRANDNPKLRNVVLLHLSDSNSDEEMFAKKAREAVPGVDIHVADAGMELELDKEPF